MRIKRFNELVGFDDEEMRDRLEIPNLRGELEPNSANMRTYSLPSSKVNTDTEVRKLVFREPILDRFKVYTKLIEGTKLISFCATSKSPVNGVEYYVQLSFAYHQNKYYIGTILRDRLDFEDEDKWVRHTFFFENIEEVYEVASTFTKVCKNLNIIDSGDLDRYLPSQN